MYAVYIVLISLVILFGYEIRLRQISESAIELAYSVTALKEKIEKI